jgi:muramoyltetrapeptide carboxypeptidase
MKAKALKKGDLIGVFAPSSWVDKAKVDTARKYLEARGFRVYIHPQTFNRFNQSAGTDDEKLAAFNELLRNKDIKAIFAAGGGNFSTHLLDRIKYRAVRDNPKIIMGFSDVTALLNAVHAKTGLITFHGPVLTWLPKQTKAMADFNFSVLSGKTPSYPMGKSRVLRGGTASGPMIGGNLSLLHLLPGTKTAPDFNGAILFIEDIGEELNHIDRMMVHLKRTGVLDKISGIICGDFSDLKDTGKPFGFTLDDIILKHVGDRPIPIVMDAPFGHDKNLYTMPVGGKAELKAGRTKATLKLTAPAVRP